MPYLFAITVIAFVALLWASFSAAGHIRRARRRRRMAAEDPLAAPTASASTLEPWLDESPVGVTPAPPPAAQALEPATAVRSPLSSQRTVRFNEAPAPPPPAAHPSSEPHDWGRHFNQDMGDLSDPTPSPRSRDRISRANRPIANIHPERNRA